MNMFKLFYKFYGTATNRFPYKLFLKEQKILRFKKKKRLSYGNKILEPKR